MKSMNIVISSKLVSRLSSHRRVAALGDTDFTDVAVVVITAADSRSGIFALLKRTGFHLLVFLYSEHAVESPVGVTAVINGDEQQRLELEFAACQYEENSLPPLYDTPMQHVETGNSTFAYLGYQYGASFKKHLARRHFYDSFGENVFRANMCNADVKLGDLLIHEGSAKDAQKFVAKVFHADRTYFVLNGTPAANKVVTNVLLMCDDLVLFDCNNHKSNHHGALTQAGATPVYLEASRNSLGFIGGIDAHCFNGEYLRQQIRDVTLEKTDLPRPYRLAIIQLGTYDGTVYNARQVIDIVGYLCDYTLFDPVWVSYEQFIPMMVDSSPLLLEPNKNDPGVFVIQSVYKQQAGFSQTSQIHKKDNHIRGQARFYLHKRLNNAFTLHASTSPFYPLFVALDANTKIHERESGRRLWVECVEIGIETRKAILACCKLFHPSIPPVVDGKLWQNYPTSVLASDCHFFNFEPGAKWHDSEGYATDQYFADPCKLLFATPDIDAETGEYSDFGVPATILAHYLRESGIVPEKCGLNSVLFPLTPTESYEKLAQLAVMLARFEQHIKDDSLLTEASPNIYNKYPACYRDCILRQLCQEMYDLYVSFDVKDLQKAMFRQQSFPSVVMNPQDVCSAYIRGDVELVRIRDAEGRIAAEGALPYPLDVLCAAPGEAWGGAVQRYFLALEEGVSLLPGFSPELQGVYSETDADGIKRLYGYVLK